MSLNRSIVYCAEIKNNDLRFLPFILYGSTTKIASTHRQETDMTQASQPNTSRAVRQLVLAQAVSEGAGVTVHRSLGMPALRHLDPFLMLDHFSSDDPDDYIAGFPDHPHRGFVTLTYMLDGHMEHRDSLGNRGDLRAGGAQWMKAASGVIHSEMPRQTNGLMRGFQLWVNLPAAEKMSAPAYQEFAPEAIPESRADGVVVRVLAGEHADVRGPIDDPHTDLHYFDARLEPDACFVTRLPGAHAGFVYVFEGEATLAGHALPRHGLGVLGPGDSVRVEAGARGARLILVAARPLAEPIVQHGPFVMNTRAEIEQAFADYRAGTLTRYTA
jgi:quercetin 2,3-dioxygenase